MENGERSDRSGLKKALVLGGGLAVAGAWFGAEPVARLMVGEPGEAPPAPTLEVAKPEPREPLNLVVGLDRSGTMKEDLPSVREAVLAFLRSNKVLAAGDGVEMCQFPDDTDAFGADCKGFVFPSQAAELEAAVQGVTIDPRGAKGKTYVNLAVRQMLERLAGKPNSVVFAWTDGKEEDKGDRPFASEGHAPVRVVVPRMEYKPDADAVAAGLGEDAEAVVARSGAEFGTMLSRFTGELDQKAQAAAQAKTAAANARNRAAYEAALREHQGQVAEIERQKGTLEGKIRSVKNWVKGTALALLALLGGAIGLDIRERRRPRLKGFLQDKRNPKYPKVYPIPHSKSPYNCQMYLQSPVVLTPTKQGVSCDGRLLKNGDQVIERVFYYESDPRTRK